MTYAPQNATVWTEIPVTDLDRSMKFYGAATDMDFDLVTDMGPNPIAIFKPVDMKSGVAGHLYPGKPATDGSGPTVHLASPGALERTVERVTAAGGTVLSEIVAIPAGRFVYCRDPDGNSVAFFETETERAG